MQAISHSSTVFAPIQTARKQPYVPKSVIENTPAQPLKADTAPSSGVWENKSFSFWDILDAINPLQHIPVISTIYRKITGDEMGYASRIAGDTLYGALFGSLISSLVTAVANVFVDSTSGKDIGEHMMASITPTPAQQKDTAAVIPPPPHRCHTSPHTTTRQQTTAHGFFFCLQIGISSDRKNTASPHRPLKISGRHGSIQMAGHGR